MNPNDTQKPWFGPKGTGYGWHPVTWQGWFLSAIFVAAEVTLVSVLPKLRPTWFAAKQVGIGYTPASWQGWAVTLAPVIIFLAVIQYMVIKQRKR